MSRRPPTAPCLALFVLSAALISISCAGGLGSSASLTPRGLSRVEQPARQAPAEITRIEEVEAVRKLRAWAVAEAARYAELASYATLEELARDRTLAGGMLTAVSHGYRFSLAVAPGGQSFQAWATPVSYGATGVHSFFTDADAVIHYADREGAPATAEDPPVR